jgi:hypothetical protein
MLIEWIIDLLIQGPLLLIDIACYHSSCPKFGGRLKYVPRATDRVQCVVCERVWLKWKGGQLSPCGPDLTSPLGNNIGGVLDYIWESWVRELDDTLEESES